MSDPEHIHIRNRKVISHHHKHPGKNKNRTTFWMLLGIIFLTAIVFIIPQFHPEKLIDSKGIWWFDAFQHIFFFFFFTLVLFRLVPFVLVYLSFFFFLILFSTFFEVMQKLLFEISFSYRDVITNFIGISLAFIIYLSVGYFKMRPKKRKIHSPRK